MVYCEFLDKESIVEYIWKFSRRDGEVNIELAGPENIIYDTSADDFSAKTILRDLNRAMLTYDPITSYSPNIFLDEENSDGTLFKAEIMVSPKGDYILITHQM